jgi:hypothetical protein
MSTVVLIPAIGIGTLEPARTTARKSNPRRPRSAPSTPCTGMGACTMAGDCATETWKRGGDVETDHRELRGQFVVTRDPSGQTPPSR